MAKDDTPGRPAKTDPSSVTAEPVKSLDRRAALARLGLVAGAAYLAPTLGLLRSAKADNNGGNSGPGGPPWAGKSKPSKPTKPSKPS